MPDMRHISKPHTRPLLVVLLFLLVFSAALMLVLPQAKALADTGPTMLSINIKNSSIYTITLDNDGVEPNQTFDVVYDAYLGSVTPPKQRDGYSFLGYFDSANKMYFDTEGKGLGKWDKTSDTTLYAHWALQIQCTFPSKALVRVDAAGNITGQEGPVSYTHLDVYKRQVLLRYQREGFYEHAAKVFF